MLVIAMTVNLDAKFVKNTKEINCQTFQDVADFSLGLTVAFQSITDVSILSVWRHEALAREGNNEPACEVLPYVSEQGFNRTS